MAEDAHSGLELFDQHGGEIHLLLTDIRLGAKTGFELAARLRSRRANLPALFMSGLVDPPVGLGGVFVQKPVDVPELVQLLERELGRAYA